MEHNKLIEKSSNNKFFLVGLLILEISLVMVLLALIVFPYIGVSEASVGVNNVTVISLLNIGNVFPEIINISLNNFSSTIDLTPNSTTLVRAYILARDYNGESDIFNASGVFFSTFSSTYGGADDNNRHYTNNSCFIDTTYGDPYEVNISCDFAVEYYADNATWNFTINLTDSGKFEGRDSRLIGINTLLALGLPNNINYGTVNATAVSDEQIANVTNFGNVPINLTLGGYAVTPGDNWSMNCTLGYLKNISIGYEKYNLTSSTAGNLNLASFQGNYTNLTAASVVRKLNVNSRQSDVAYYIDDTNATYWRIYVPLGVAGTCQGNIVFGATQSAGV